MNLLKYIGCACIVVVIASSCKKDFLEVENTTFINRQTHVNDLASMGQFLNGIYINISLYMEAAFATCYPELAADNIKHHPSIPRPILVPHYSWDQQAEEGDGSRFVGQTSNGNLSSSLNAIWINYYLMIRSCNFVIEEVDKYRSENSAKANDIKAQALALRALLHFRLVNIFAQPYAFSTRGSHPGVPYISVSNIMAPYTRQSVAEVYSAMENDLKLAIDNFSPTPTDTRYMNLYAAKALLARVYLFREDYMVAKNLVQELCQQMPLLTIANGYPRTLFEHKPLNDSEILFQVSPLNQSGVVSVFIGLYFSGSFQFFIATDDIGTLLTERPDDIRREWTSKGSNGLWTIKKYPTGLVPGISLSETAYYQPVIRSSEMFLTAAEVYAQLGNEDSARYYVDAIRKRADPTIATLSTSGAALLDTIYKERRKELSFEGLRLFDLQRLKQGVHRIDAPVASARDLPFPSNKAIAPIPINDVKLAGLSQNPGY